MMSKLLTLSVFVLFLTNLSAQEYADDRVLQRKPKKYRIDDWSTQWMTSYRNGFGNNHVVVIAYGKTVVEDFAIGGFVGYQGNTSALQQMGIGFFGRHYSFEGPWRMVNSLELSRIMWRSESARLNRIESGSYAIDIGSGIAYPISRLGDPLNLELLVRYRSPFVDRTGLEEGLYLALTLALYM